MVAATRIAVVVEGVLTHGFNDHIVIDPEVLEEGLVQSAAAVVVGALVAPVRVVEPFVTRRPLDEPAGPDVVVDLEMSLEISVRRPSPP